MDLSFPSGYSVIDGIFLKILTCIWANIISYNYPGLTGLSNSSMREVVTVLFSRKTCAELIVSFPLIGKITIYCTRFSLSGQICFETRCPFGLRSLARYWVRGKFGEHERGIRVMPRTTSTSWVLSKLPKCSISRQVHSWNMNKLFYNITKATNAAVNVIWSL